MASLLKMALEGSLGGIFGQMDTSGGADNTSGQPEASEGSPTRDTNLVLRGPLAVQFSEALARLYNKHEPERVEDAQVEGAQTTAPETAATESQANDALGLQELVNNVRIMSESEAEDSSTTVYGVDAEDVKPEDIVQVSQDIENVNPDDYFVVMNETPPSEALADSGSSRSAMATALESLCLKKGIKVYPSYEAFGQACLGRDKFALEGIFFKSEADKEVLAKARATSNKLADLVRTIANALEKAIRKGWSVKLSGSNDNYKVVISAVEPTTGKILHASASVN